MMEPLIITVATTGGGTTREQTPFLPITPEEIADEIYASWQAGAAIAHVHVRDPEGRRSSDIEYFRRVVRLVQERCDIILNLTTSGPLDDERILPVTDLRPEMASFDAGSTNLNDWVFVNHPAFLERLAKEMLDNGVKPEIEVFETGFINNALVIAKKGLLNRPFISSSSWALPEPPRPRPRTFCTWSSPSPPVPPGR